MKFLNELAQVKRMVTVEGSTMYVTDKGRVRPKLLKGEKQAYRVEKTDGKQYVYDQENRQIQPKRKPRKKSASKLPDFTDEVSGGSV